MVPMSGVTVVFSCCGVELLEWRKWRKFKGLVVALIAVFPVGPGEPLDLKMWAGQADVAGFRCKRQTAQALGRSPVMEWRQN